MSKVIQKVGIVGAGTMGSGIAINCVTNGFDVVLCDRNQLVLDAARNRLDNFLTRQVQKERLTVEGAACAAKRLVCTENTDGLADSDIVVEAVFENLDLKRKIFAELEQIVSDGTILASNTSCLRIADICSAMRNAKRFCGMHYFSPAEINPVVELIEGPKTSSDVLVAAKEFLGDTNKEIIACKDQNGFALNRFFCPYTNEAVRLLDEGVATKAQIDEVAKLSFGSAMGPFAVMNIVGTAVNLNAVRNLEPLGPFYSAAKGLIDAGENNTRWDIEAIASPLQESTSSLVQTRLTGAVLLAVREAIDEGVTTLQAIDKGAWLAFRFTKTPGILIDELGEANVERMVKILAQQHKHRSNADLFVRT